MLTKILRGDIHMTEFINFFKSDNYENSIFGSFIYISSVLSVIDILIHIGLIHIQFPEGGVTIEISALMIIVLNISPLVFVIFCWIEELLVGYSHLSTYICCRIYSMLLFCYSFYCVIDSCEGILIKPSFSWKLSGIAFLAIKIIRYCILIMLCSADFYARAVHTSFALSYNTYNFQFFSPLKKVQIDEIRLELEKPLTEEDNSFDVPFSKKRREELLRYRYIEFTDRGFMIGFYTENGILHSLNRYVELISSRLTSLNYEYQVTVSKENYDFSYAIVLKNEEQPSRRIVRITN